MQSIYHLCNEVHSERIFGKQNNAKTTRFKVWLFPGSKYSIIGYMQCWQVDEHRLFYIVRFQNLYWPSMLTHTLKIWTHFEGRYEYSNVVS